MMKPDYGGYAGVQVGAGTVVEEHCLLGVPPRGHQEGDLQTCIGEGAHFRSHTVVYAGNRIGKNFQTGNKVNIREENEIGDNVSVGTLSVIEHHVKIGNGVRIHTQVFIPEYSVLEDAAWLGPHVVLTNAKYPVSPDVKANLAGPTIKRGAKIGANATILPGVVVGEYALV
jgi:UDP-3-O-[3-hydroxymyristoyl] glucosamine N-acyltransferase